MAGEELTSSIVFQFGVLEITNTVVTSWAITVITGVVCWLSTRDLQIAPGRFQTSLEGLVSSMEAAVDAVSPEQSRQIMPFIATIWIFLVIANLSGLIPGIHSPTRDLSATVALAILVFLSVHWFGIRHLGIKRYLLHYLAPNPVLLPFHIISEVTRTIALAVRLFGNMMSLEMAAFLILLVAGFLVPVPILMLHIVEALVQAYIFGMLALVYVAGGIQSQQIRQQRRA